MLPKKERLSRVEFNRFFSIGKRVHSPLFQIIAHSHPTLHVSVVVSKKITTSAVQRNKIRRQIYDIVRNYRRTHTVRGVFIIVVKAPILSVPYAEIKKEVCGRIEEILQRHGSSL